jgi:hypothetical protein
LDQHPLTADHEHDLRATYVLADQPTDDWLPALAALLVALREREADDHEHDTEAA